MSFASVLAEINASEDAVAQYKASNRADELQDTTTAAAPPPKTRKRKTPPTKTVVSSKKSRKNAVEFQMPKIPKRQTSLPGGGAKQPGVLFVAVFEDANALGKVLGKLHKFQSTGFLLEFTSAGLRIHFIDTAHVMMLLVEVPAASFARFDPPTQSSIVVGISSMALKRFGDMCTAQHSLTFMYDQCGNNDEPLHLMLYPRTGDMADGQQISRKLAVMDLEEMSTQPLEGYAYRVRMPANLFLKNVRSLGKEASTVRLALSKSHFEMIAVSDENLDTLSMHIGRQQSNGVDNKPSELGTASCVIERLEDASAQVVMKQLRNYQLGAVFLEGAANLGAFAWCDECVLRMGIARHEICGGSDDERAYVYDAMPLHMTFPMCRDTSHEFSVQAWLAPKFDRDD